MRPRSGEKTAPLRPAAAISRPQLGSPEDQAVLQRGLCGDGAGYELGVRGGGCAADVEGDDVGDAFAVGDDLVGEGLADFGEGGVEGGGQFPAELDAAGSAGDEQHSVVGGGVAVDGDGVEAGLDGGGECGVEVGNVGGDVGEEIDEHGGVRRGPAVCRRVRRAPGPIMPAPLAQPQMRTSALTGDSGPAATGMTAWAILTRVSVVMMAWAKAEAWSGVEPTAALSAGMAATTFSAGKGTPMMPVDEGTTSSKMQPKVWAAATQVETQPSMPGLAGGAVGVAGVDEDRSDAASGGERDGGGRR